MIEHVGAVALNTFRETVRDRVLYLAGLFGVALVGASVVLAPLTIGAQDKVIADVGLAAASLLGLLVVLLVGGGMVHKEIDKRTITTILARPVARRSYIYGKFAGLCLTLLILLAVMGALFVTVALAMSVGLHAGYAVAFLFTFLELMVVTALVVLLSTFVSPVLAAVFTLGLFVCGRLSGDIKAFGEVMGGPLLRVVTQLVYYALPNLELFNVRGAVVHGAAIPTPQVWLATLYAVSTSALLLLLAGALFARRELK